jgi:hypothetical protein
MHLKKVTITFWIKSMKDGIATNGEMEHLDKTKKILHFQL